MRNIWPNYFQAIRTKNIKKMWRKTKDKAPERKLDVITNMRIKPVIDVENQTNSYYEKAYARLNSKYKAQKKPMPYHFIIDCGGRILQHRGIHKIIGEENELTIGVVKNKRKVSTREAYAIKSIVNFFQKDIKNVFWEVPEWARYAATTRQQEDEFERIWKDTIPSEGEVTLDDFKSIMKLIFLKK